jgi:hypothetical protein
MLQHSGVCQSILVYGYPYRCTALLCAGYGDSCLHYVCSWFHVHGFAGHLAAGFVGCYMRIGCRQLVLCASVTVRVCACRKGCRARPELVICRYLIAAICWKSTAGVRGSRKHNCKEE